MTETNEPFKIEVPEPPDFPEIIIPDIKIPEGMVLQLPPIIFGPTIISDHTQNPNDHYPCVSQHLLLGDNQTVPPKNQT